MKKMVYYVSKWHKWIGIILCIPLIIIAITSIFIVFQDSYKNKPSEPQINVSWLPGYSKILSEKEFINKSSEIKASLHFSENTFFLATASGLFYQYEGEFGFVKELIGYDIRDIKAFSNQLFICTKNGLYKMSADISKLELIGQMDIHGIEVLGDSLIYASTKKGLLISYDYGQTWLKDQQSHQQIVQFAKHSLSEQPRIIPLHKLILDLHTGKSFFGKTFEWIWILLAGVNLSFLTITGLWISIRRLLKKKQKNFINKNFTS
jgi:hypothetical protein